VVFDKRVLRMKRKEKVQITVHSLFLCPDLVVPCMPILVVKEVSRVNGCPEVCRLSEVQGGKGLPVLGHLPGNT
jgi:hypothetical protein